MRKIRHKFGAVRCQMDDIKFPSMLERNVYKTLKDFQENQRIRFFLRQIRFDLPGGLKHYVDYAVFTESEVLFIESKGHDLEAGKNKRLQASDIYGVEINVVHSIPELLTLLSDQRVAGEGKILC